MGEHKRELSDQQWARLSRLLPGKPTDPGRSGSDNRLFVEAVLWQARNGARWRDLPERFGPWNSVFVRFRRWTRAGVWERAFAALASDPLWEWTVVDATIVRAHQHAAGAKGGAPARPLAGPEGASAPRSTS
jgi:putative transposase